MLDKLQKNVNARSLTKKAAKEENKVHAVPIQNYLKRSHWKDVV